MNDKIFRKKSVERMSSPEQLNDYIKVTNPGVWSTAYQSRSVTEQALPWVLSCFRSYSSLFSDSARPNTDLLIKEKANNGKGYYPPTFLRR